LLSVVYVVCERERVSEKKREKRRKEDIEYLNSYSKENGKESRSKFVDVLIQDGKEHDPVGGMH